MIRLAATILAALTLASCAPAAPPSATARLEGFAWLEGCWLSRDGAVERWEPAEGALMRGAGLLPGADGEQISEEFRIDITPAGEVAFHAQLQGQSEIAYALVSRAESAAIFENPDNPAPKRIAYARAGDTLTATLYESLTPDARGWATRYQPCDSTAGAP